MAASGETAGQGVTSPRLIFTESDITFDGSFVPQQVSRAWEIFKKMDAKDWVLALGSAWLVKWMVLRPYKMRIAGKIIFVNGATTKLGVSLCRAAWREGASLFMVSKKKTALHQLHRELSKTGQHTRLRTFVLEPGAKFEEAAVRCSDALGAPDVVVNCEEGDMSMLAALQESAARVEAGSGFAADRYAAGSSMQLCASFLPAMQARDKGVFLAVQPAMTSGAGGGAWRESLRWMARMLAEHLLVPPSAVLGPGLLCQEVVVPRPELEEVDALPLPSACNGRQLDAALVVLQALSERSRYSLHVELNVWRSPSAFLTPLLKFFGIRRVLCCGFVIEVQEGPAEKAREAAAPPLYDSVTPRGDQVAADENPTREWILHGTPSKLDDSADEPVMVSSSPQSRTAAPPPPSSNPTPAPGPGSAGPWRTANPNPVIKAGLGIMLSEEHNGLQIVVVEKGSPADKSADINRGDVVVAVDRVRVAGKSSEVVLDMMQGAPNSTVSITVKSSGPGQVERTVELRRGAAKDSAWITRDDSSEAGPRKGKAKC